MQGKFTESPNLARVSTMLDTGLVDVKECWSVVNAMVSPLGSCEVEKQAGLTTSWWSNQHTLDWLGTYHISLTD